MKESLIKIVLSKSQSDVLEEAKKEWEVISAYYQPDSVCDCGHRPLSTVITLSNDCTGEVINIGNVCVKEFLGHNLAELTKELDQPFFVNKSPSRDVLEVLEYNAIITREERNLIDNVFYRPKKYRNQSTLDKINKVMRLRKKMRFGKKGVYNLKCLVLRRCLK